MAEKTNPIAPETAIEAPQPDPLLMRQQQLMQQLQQTNTQIMELKRTLEATISQADRIYGALTEIAYHIEQKG
jgi:hypothetical protein